MGLIRSGLLTSCGLIAACASISVREYNTDTSVAPTLSNERVPGSVVYTTRAAVHGESLSVEIEQSETCAEITTQRVRRIRSVARTADPSVSRTTWLVAALAFGGGGYAYFNADGLAARSDSDGDADTYRQTGSGLAVVGVAALALGIVDALRAVDDEHDDGLIAGASTRTESVCEKQKTRDRDLRLVLADGYVVTARLDHDGIAEVAFHSVPEPALPDGSQSVEVLLGDDRTALTVPSESWSNLRTSLLADPRSRVATDVLEKRLAQCARAVAVARAATQPEPSRLSGEAGSSWHDAKTSCSDLWTADLEGELASVERRLLEARCTERFDFVDATLASQDATALDSIEGELARAQADCLSEGQLARSRQLRAQLDAFEKKIARIAAEDARRLAREQDREDRDERRREQAARHDRESSEDGALMCNDGTESPTCTCGGSHQGCCSHHRGIAGCSQ